jgi:hypothetical protein
MFQLPRHAPALRSVSRVPENGRQSPLSNRKNNRINTGERAILKTEAESLLGEEIIIIVTTCHLSRAAPGFLPAAPFLSRCSRSRTYLGLPPCSLLRRVPLPLTLTLSGGTSFEKGNNVGRGGKWGNLLDMLPHHRHRVWIGLHQACTGSGYTGVFVGLGYMPSTLMLYLEDCLMCL